MSLYQRLDGIAKRMDELETQVRAVGNQPQAQRTSVEGGSIDFNDADGNLRAIVGEQFDGGTTINVVAGPTPPTPTAPVAEVTYGGIKVRWDGMFEDDAIAPTDFSRVQVYAKAGGFVTPTPENAKGSIVSAAGDEVSLGVEKGTHTVCLAAWSQAGKPSAMSAPVTVEVPGYGDLVQAAIDEAQRLIDQAKQALETAQQELDGKLTAVAGELESVPADIAKARQEAIDAALAEIDAVEGNLTTALGLKNKTTWSTSNPPTTYAGVVEDTWIKLTSLGSGGREIGRWRWNGNVWVTHVIDGAVLSNIEASTITTGFLDVVNRIRAYAIAADKILVGAGGNLIPWDQVKAGETTAPHAPYGSGAAISLEPANASLSLGPHMRLKAAGTSGVNISASFRPSTQLNHKIARGDKLVLRFRVYPISTTPVQVQPRIYWYNQPSAILGYVSSGGGNTVTLPPGVVTEVSVAMTAPVTAPYAMPFISVTAGAEVGIVDADFRSQVGGTLIEPGGIQTPHLAADVLEVGNLKAGSAALAEAVIQKLWAEVVVARMVTAQEFIGENAILTGAITAPKITASEELTAKIAEFLRVRAEMIEADAINGMFIRGATFETLDGRGRWADDGLTMFDENQDWRVRLTPYGSTFKGDLEAESLVATGPAEFRHTENRLGQGAKLVLDAGVADPTAPPVVQPYWASRSFTPPEGGVLYGLAWADGKYWTFVDAPNASEGDRLISIDPASGAIGDNIPMTDQFWAAGGVTAIGSELFLLGQKSGTPYKYFVRVYSTAGAFLREWEYTDVGWSKTNPLTYKPGIGTDGTNVVIAQCADGGNLLWRTYNTTTGATIATVDCKDGTKSDIGGIYIGPGDWGGGTFVTVRKTSGNVGDAIVTFSTSGVWDPAKSWKTAENGRDTGLAFADGKFRTLNGGGGRINEYAPPTTGDDSPDWWVAYRWETDFNSDNALDYTSRISPPTRFTWPRRARLKALGSPLPVGVETIGGFTAKKATTPERTDFRRSFTNTQQGKSVALWYYLDSETTVPAEVNTYPTATPSSIVSASNTYEVKGDGTGRWGPLTFNPNGTVTGVPKVASGVVQLNVPSNNGRVSATVTLPAGRFTTKPAIQVTARTAWPVVHAATFIDETTTSFVVWARRDTAGPLDVAWTAIGE
ncbi:hypothetical protein [Brevibacterium casei]|uniref:Uncharacterized protein n=1 Tax=Brevibacterium casei CIP 102111 TaxID=1255625 RepID=A0A2H1IVY9_9MICO|nr:hypothetical protein [Brevibacterium casei]QPR39602.1 hypothetical protein I6G94_01510 [Brevibacterium casei]QPR43766.1 hypothetical protein I6G93_16790 [Brevibacterium casei]SMX79397.1 hypothetical protein BC102111_01649 [Brevibacterium casei CIP 102111]